MLRSIFRVAGIVVPFFIAAIFFIDNVSYDASDYFFASIFPQHITVKELQQRYQQEQIRILLVPGHDREFPGAMFGGVKEADLTLELAEDIFNMLKRDNRFVVYTARNFQDGNYTKTFSSYFTSERSGIESFREQLRQDMKDFMRAGEVERNVSVYHNFAPSEVAVRLYGINKWANEHAIDIVLHIHLNDYPRRYYRVPGRYNGFAFYIPERQYPNAEISTALAHALLQHFGERFPESDFPLERGGIIESQDLIAVGANASRMGASLLIEYGYIYEPQFQHAEIRESAMRELAFQTYKGLKSFFHDDQTNMISAYNTLLLPYQWSSSLQKGIKGNSDVFALQAALFEEQVYPPAGKTLLECPINGNFGPCTEQSVKAFQEKYQTSILLPLDLYGGTGIVGPATIEKLNSLFNG